MRNSLPRNPVSYFFPLMMLFLLLPSTAFSSTYWAAGVLNRDISVCFAGNAVTARPARVREIVNHLQHFEWAANIKLKSLAGNSILTEIGTGGNINNLACPAPITQPNGNSYYNGDIRVALWSTNVDVNPPGKIPGVGCTEDKVGSSFGSPPDSLTVGRPCQYNLKLGDDSDDPVTGIPTGVPWLNHTLHEFGHALGLCHEFVRADIDPACGQTGSWTDNWITNVWDRASVMNYVFVSCQAWANYDDTGLSAGDQLAVHIMYPEDSRVAEFVGTTVIQTGQTLSLQAGWKARGAYAPFVFKTIGWWVGGALRSTTPDLSLAGLTAGDHALLLNYTDFLDRTHSYSGTVRVLSPANYTIQTAGNMTAVAPILTVDTTSVFLPVVTK